MRRTRVLLVVAAALASVAASGPGATRPSRAGATATVVTTIPVGFDAVRNLCNALTESRRPLRAPAGECASKNVLNDDTTRRLR